MSEKNKTTTAVSTIGGAAAVMLLFVASKVGLDMTTVEAGSLVVAITFAINFFVPASWANKAKQ